MHVVQKIRNWFAHFYIGNELLIIIKSLIDEFMPLINTCVDLTSNYQIIQRFLCFELFLNQFLAFLTILVSLLNQSLWIWLVFS